MIIWLFHAALTGNNMSLLSRHFRFLVATCAVATLIGCAGGYTSMPSKNTGERVKVLVMHFTAIDYQKSVHALVDEGGLSSHYLVTDPSDPTFPGDEASVLQLVPVLLPLRPRRLDHHLHSTLTARPSQTSARPAPRAVRRSPCSHPLLRCQ